MGPQVPQVHIVISITLLPTFFTSCLFGESHPKKEKVVFYGVLNLHFSDN
jgi:hypothetical protein